MNIQELNQKFPPVKTCGVTGYIPMEYFTANEADIRHAMRQSPRRMRIRWRGPRPGPKKDAQRGTAVAAVIYPRV